MMRQIFCFLLMIFCLYANVSQNLKENEKIQKQLNEKLNKLAKEILENDKKIKDIQNQIKSSTNELSKLEELVKVQSIELKDLSSQNSKLEKQRATKENKLTELIAKNFAYDLPLFDGYLENKESFILFEILKKLNIILNDEINELSKDYEKLSSLINQKQTRIKDINNNIQKYNNQLKKLSNLKKDLENKSKKQESDKKSYEDQLLALQERQNELRQTLAQLQIVKKQPSIQIKQLGSSYQEANIKKYKGAKTIAPLESFTIKQEFGNFIDPVYKIKLFNENIILTSTTANATVKNVLKGKVVFAKETNLLQKVIIIEHSNGLHTIYAHLDKIAPTIKVGINVEKGSIIGRVKDDLIFEVTQEKFHINPLELISLK